MCDFKWTGVALGVVALLLRWMAARFPVYTEQIYSRTTFPMIRQVIDVSIAKLPFPTVFIFVVVVVGTIAWFLFRNNQRPGWHSKIRHLVRSLLNFGGVLIFLFLFLWGYNYQRIPVYQQLSLEPAFLSPDELAEEMELTHEILSTARQTLSSDTLAIEKTIPYPQLEAMVRNEIKQALPRLGFDGRGCPRTREFIPGFLKKMGIVGIYFPFTGEGYIESGLHDLEKPFTVAHEMAHSFGITNEGEANFISWLVGMQSEEGLLQYAAQLQLLRYQLSELSRRDPEAYKDFVAAMDTGIKNDLIAILIKARETPPLFNSLSRKSNDLYLKTQGVRAGVQSYAQLPALAYAWRKSAAAGLDD